MVGSCWVFCYLDVFYGFVGVLYLVLLVFNMLDGVDGWGLFWVVMVCVLNFYGIYWCGCCKEKLRGCEGDEGICF